MNLTTWALTSILAGPNIPVGPAVAPPGTEAGFSTLLGWLTLLGYGLCVVGLIAIGAALPITHRRGEGMGEHAGKLGAVGAGAIIIGAAPAIIGAL